MEAMEVYTLQFVERPSTYYVFDKENWELLGENPNKAIPVIMWQSERCTCSPCHVARYKRFQEMLSEKKMIVVGSRYTSVENIPYPFGTKKDNSDEQK